MPDMLVNLLKLPSQEPLLTELREKGIVIRPAHPFEATTIRNFIVKHFGTGWADEVIPCLNSKPVSLLLAVREGKMLGFGAYEATRRNFFGPTGVAEAERGLGIGKALLLACLWSMRDMGYAYGVIGGAGPVEFYAKAVGATVIPESVPGIYKYLLKGD